MRIFVDADACPVVRQKPRKRTEEDNEKFMESLERLLVEINGD